MTGQDENASRDYYAFLNVKRDASVAEITAAYRRLSTMFHPDRHNADPELKDKAEDMFNMAQEAYKVLTDTHKRAIYDAIGKPGLAVEGWELVERRYNPNEIREEYERLKKIREEQELTQLTNPSVRIEVTLNASDIWQPIVIDDSEYYYSEFPYVEVQSITAAQSIEAPISQTDRLVIGGALETKNGVGAGNISLVWRRILSDRMWCQTEAGVGADSSLNCCYRLVRNLSKHLTGTAQLFTQLGKGGVVAPILTLALTQQLRRSWSGTFTVKLGAQSAAITNLVYDDALHNRCVATVSVGLSAVYGLIGYTYKFTENDAKARIVLKGGNVGLVCEASYERSISTYNSFGFTCRIHFPKGVTVRLRFQRSAQVYQLNIILCEHEIVPSAVLWASVVPLLTYNLVAAVARPFLEKRHLRKLLENQKNTSKVTELRRKEAEAAVELMSDAAERSRDTEERRSGLVIVEAWYGNLVSLSSNSLSPVKLIDVIKPLQALVKDSKLTIFESPKFNLPGFYDPCVGEEKSLKVIYKFRNELHSVVVSDAEPLTIPKQSHTLTSNGREFPVSAS